MRRSALVAAVTVWVASASAIAACVIGPKQDDPANPTLRSDTGVTDPDVGSIAADTNSDPAATDGAADTNPGLVADAAADSRGEVCPDGGVPLTAQGPWDDGKKCWKGLRVFECVTGIDGGAAMTCFVEVSTGDFYLAPSTHIPSGSNYRECTTMERGQVGSASEVCK